MFEKIPGVPVAYWLSIKFASIFNGKKVEDFALKVCKGGFTANNDKYLRYWQEVCYSDILMGKWHQYSKGGQFCKWYGNSQFVIYWPEDGAKLKGDPRAGMGAAQYYGKTHIVWSGICSGKPSFRADPDNVYFDDVSPAVVFDNDNRKNYILCALNSIVAERVLAIIAPTIHFQAGDIKQVPVIMIDERKKSIDLLADNNVDIAKQYWDSFETSWDFQRHPLVCGCSTIEAACAQWETICNDRFTQLKANEEELNRIFIDIYGLQDELTPEVEEKDVTVRKADLQRDIKSLLSYAVGCMFGRYSIYKDGLLFAGEPYSLQAFVDKLNDRPGTISAEELQRAYRNEGVVVDEMFFPDADNVIPITDEEYLDDDIVSRLCAWLKAVYGADTLEANLDYIAKALGNKGSTSREIIRNYFLNDFFKDHCKTYSVTGSGKRPIYWLFDSGKQNGFKALIYLHRYTPDTIGNLRIDYLHKMQRVYESEINRMQDMMDHSGNAREVAAASKRKDKLAKQLKECREYDEKISHLALSRIELDLDDGVKVNYRKLQTAQDGKFYEVLADSKNIMVKEKK